MPQDVFEEKYAAEYPLIALHVEQVPLDSQEVQPGVAPEQVRQTRSFGSRNMLLEQEIQFEVPLKLPGEHDEQLVLDWLQERQDASHFTQFAPDITKSFVLHGVHVDPPMTETAVR